MTTKTDIILKPCPFCGGEAEMDTRQGYLALGTGRLGNRIAVYCRSCNADMGVCVEDVPDIEPEQVADMWNRRAAVEADRDRIPKLVESDKQDQSADLAEVVGQPAASAQPAVGADDDAVEHFAAAMKDKLAQARAKGRHGWQECDPSDLSQMLRAHVEKGDPRDVANFCMFLWSLGQPISAAPVAMDALIAEVETLLPAKCRATVAQEPVAWLRNERGTSSGLATFDPLVLLSEPVDGAYRASYQPLYAAPVAAQAQHPDDAAVDAFAAAMKTKLAQKRAEGRGGWEDKAQCSQDRLSLMLRGHVAKGDPVDVGNFCMMLHQRGERISDRDAASPSAQDREDAGIDAAFEAVRKRLCSLPRYSFMILNGGVRRQPDKAGNWLEFDQVHALFDPVAIDAARAAKGE